MTVAEELKIAEDLMKVNEDLLILKIGEAWDNWQHNNKVNKEERFLLGLRYSEFFADQSLCGEEYDWSLVRAAHKAQIYREKLGVTFDFVYNGCKNILGLA